MSATVYPRRPVGASELSEPRRTGAQRFARRLLAAAAPILVSSCASLVPIQQDVALGEEAYSDILGEGAPPVTSGPQAEMVQRVTDRLVRIAVEQHPEFDVFPWEVTLLDAPTVNAFCLPGGKMAVYTGILPYTETETGLAVVMGHEIAHATLRHGIEKVQSSSITQAGAVLAGEYFNIDPELLSTAAGIVIHLPYGRGQELEADRYGLLYMARAGYDPREAVAFWRRMAQAGGEKPPELLSTHPSDTTRIDQIEEMLPEALALYEAARASGRP